jgi:hypothetical protein
VNNERLTLYPLTIRDEEGKPVAGKKTMIVLMLKDKKQQATGGWLLPASVPTVNLQGSMR